MNFPSIDKLLTKVPSKYVLVHIVSRRSKQINKTGHLQKKANEYKSAKSLGRALEEVAESLIHIV